MSNQQPHTQISDDVLRSEIKKEYASVALYPDKGYHFHTGREAARRIGYDEALYSFVPEENIASFAGTGNPFGLGPIRAGDIVVDVGSGSGFDTLIASKLVKPRPGHFAAGRATRPGQRVLGQPHVGYDGHRVQRGEGQVRDVRRAGEQLGSGIQSGDRGQIQGLRNFGPRRTQDRKSVV